MAASFSFHKGRTEICCTFLWAEGVQGAELHTHSFMCPVWGPGSFWEKYILIGRKKARQG